VVSMILTTLMMGSQPHNGPLWAIHFKEEEGKRVEASSTPTGLDIASLVHKRGERLAPSLKWIGPLRAS